MCSVMMEDRLPPAEVKECNLSSSTISGMKTNDEIVIVIAFSGQSKEVK